MMKKLNLLALVCALFIMTSCEKDEELKLPGDVKDFKFLEAKSYTEWTYFSFSKGDTVNVTDFQNDLSWDIAFHRGDIRLNGGASGKGKGEAINTGVVVKEGSEADDWTSVAEAPKDGYSKDEVGKVTIAFTGANIEEEDQPFSQVASTWITIDTSNPPPKYTYHNNIYIVKAADGNYVKLWVYDYKNEKNAAGYVSFRYQYNESGASTFN